MENKPVVPLDCLFQGCYNPDYEAEISKCKDKCYKYNHLNPNDRAAQQEILKDLKTLHYCGRARNFESVGNNYVVKTVWREGQTIENATITIASY